MKFALLAAAGSFALIGGAHAQEGWYGQVGAGVVLESDSNDFESDDSTPAAFSTDIGLDNNLKVYGALGRYFQNNIRGELELATRSQNVDSLVGDGLGFAGFADPSGDVSATTLMANVFKDFDIDADERLTPYLGVGLGVARVRTEMSNSFSNVATTVADMGTANFLSVEDTGHALALQGIAGLTYDFSENMLFDLRYNYLTTGEYEIDSYINGPEALSTGEFSEHAITAGLRWNWGVPVAPVPAPVTTKTCFDGSVVPVTSDCPQQFVAAAPVKEMEPLIVYFDYNKSNLTPASSSLIEARAAEALDADVTGVSVSGNTDSSGSSAYNQALSARRAAVVKDALVANGIDADVISMEALGESNPARPTEDGVREPLNRRTEVEFMFD